MEGARKPVASSLDEGALIEVFEYALDDWISMSTVAGILKHRLGVPDERVGTELRRWVEVMVTKGWFVPGTVEEPAGFTALERPLGEVLGEICDGWTWDEPTWWYALWLDLTPEGRAAALRLDPGLGGRGES